MSKEMSKQMGRDDARERIKKAVLSHGTQAHQTEANKNKKQNADLKADIKTKHK